MFEIFSVIKTFIMRESEETNSLRENIQNNLFKFIIILIVIAVLIFSYQKDGFYFGIS